MTAFSHLPYRPCVGVMLLDGKGRVFVARRIDTRSDAWQMPQGGVDDGESPREAVMREMREEIGTDKAELLHEIEDWLSYDLPDHLIPVLWGGKYRGQTQKWFILRFTGSDDDINIDTHEPEFCEWKWVEPETLPDLIVPFKRALYTDLVQRLTAFNAKAGR